jgi:chemotaxis protein CheY-P-specific phosphatase CheC
MNVKIGAKIKELRKRDNITQEQLAEFLGVTNQAISKWESENGYPDIGYISSIADFFNVTIDYLFDYKKTCNMDIFEKAYNLSMSAAATQMSNLLNKKAVIDTHKTEIGTHHSNLAFAPGTPTVAVKMNYIVGLQGENVFIFNQYDVVKIVDIWMGGTGQNDSTKFNEAHMNALSELMNQMMGQSSMALAKFLNMPIDIDSSGIEVFKIENDNISIDGMATVLNFTVDNAIDSKIIVVAPLYFYKDIISKAKKAFGMDDK